MFYQLRNHLLNRHRYHGHPKAVIIACFFNPQKSAYRLLAFQKWYASIRHLDHRILECLIGDDTTSQLPASPWITQTHTPELLWHKETLLNTLIAELPRKYAYVFWLDTDVLFTNQRWLVEGVEVLQRSTILQPFKYGIHLERHETVPDFDVDQFRKTASEPTKRHPRLWRSFAANCGRRRLASDPNYDRHGHVGFVWGARREVLDAVPLYDQALIGGADHIIAHAAAGHIGHSCIVQAFAETLPNVLAWSNNFFAATQGKVGYVPGDLYHLWHGDVAQRQYFQRIKGFAKDRSPASRTSHGFWSLPRRTAYVRQYYQEREVLSVDDYAGYDAGFVDTMGYALSDIPRLFGPSLLEDSNGPEVLPEADKEDVELTTFVPLAAPENAATSDPVSPNFS